MLLKNNIFVSRQRRTVFESIILHMIFSPVLERVGDIALDDKRHDLLEPGKVRSRQKVEIGPERCIRQGALGEAIGDQPETGLLIEGFPARPPLMFVLPAAKARRRSRRRQAETESGVDPMGAQKC